jgi:hypothetical protein
VPKLLAALSELFASSCSSVVKTITTLTPTTCCICASLVRGTELKLSEMAQSCYPFDLYFMTLVSDLGAVELSLWMSSREDASMTYAVLSPQGE